MTFPAYVFASKQSFLRRSAKLTEKGLESWTKSTCIAEGTFKAVQKYIVETWEGLISNFRDFH